MVSGSSNTENKRSSRFEIILLFRLMKPCDIVRLGYSKATVYSYYKKYKEARKKALEILRERGIYVPDNLI